MANLDLDETRKFDALAQRWWDPEGPMAPLHKLNPTRLAFLRDAITARFGLDPETPAPLKGKRALDVGCGAGLLSEPLARLGASVIGLEPSPDLLRCAQDRAAAQDLDIVYRSTLVEDLAAAGERFDLVTALEVIEHVDDQEGFARACAQCVAPGGLLAFSTLNRTRRAWLEAIIGAEWVLGWLPRGTHDWNRFVKPSELARFLRKEGFAIADAKGFAWRAAQDDFTLTNNLDVNYIVTARR